MTQEKQNEMKNQDPELLARAKNWRSLRHQIRDTNMEMKAAGGSAIVLGILFVADVTLSFGTLSLLSGSVLAAGTGLAASSAVMNNNNKKKLQAEYAQVSRELRADLKQHRMGRQKAKIRKAAAPTVPAMLRITEKPSADFSMAAAAATSANPAEQKKLSVPATPKP